MTVQFSVLAYKESFTGNNGLGWSFTGKVEARGLRSDDVYKMCGEDQRYFKKQMQKAKDKKQEARAQKQRAQSKEHESKQKKTQ